MRWVKWVKCSSHNTHLLKLPGIIIFLPTSTLIILLNTSYNRPSMKVLSFPPYRSLISSLHEVKKNITWNFMYMYMCMKAAPSHQIIGYNIRAKITNSCDTRVPQNTMPCAYWALSVDCCTKVQYNKSTTISIHCHHVTLGLARGLASSNLEPNSDNI